MKNIYPALLFSLMVAMYSPSFGSQLDIDSTQAKQQAKKSYSTTLTLRMHSMGFFSFMGRLASDNPAADVYFNYTRNNGWGFQIFKAADLYDLHGDNNFALGLVFKHLHINEKLTITPYAGGVLEQSHHVIGKGSDFSSMINTTYKVNSHFTIDHMALFPNLVLERVDADWTNRFRLTYSNKHLDVIGWGWHNNKVFDHATYVTSGLSIYYSRIPVQGKLSLSMGITGLKVLSTSNQIDCPKKDGILLTIAGTWH